uniref:RING-type E3 ubiquitin transferase n=1 Tax=Sphenodon punctatus TaxID=8508 RepID=A0A8D0L314_SPHPU
MAVAMLERSADMGPPNAVETLQEEAVCAICLDYFTDPVSIGCGHNFCRVCITQLWITVAAGEEAEEGGSSDDNEGGADSDGDHAPSSEAGDDDAGMGDLEVEEDADDGDDEEEDDYEDLGNEDMDEDEEEEEATRGEERFEDDMWGEEEEGEYWDEDPVDGDMWEDEVGSDLFLEEYDDEEEEVMEEEELEEEEEAAAVPATPSPPPLPRSRPQPFSCPQCRQTFSQRSFRPNRQLANMVYIIRQMHPQPHRPVGEAGAMVSGGTAATGASFGVVAAAALHWERAVCAKHQEPLKLFCEADEEAICVVCRESRSHKHHSVIPLEEVVQEYKAKLEGHLDPLKKNLEAILKQKLTEEEKIDELKNKMKLDIQEFESDFERLHQFLLGEQVLQLQQLKERYELLLARQSSNVSHLEEQGKALSRLITEAEDKSKQDGLQLLKDIKGTFFRCENIKFQEPEMALVDVGKKYRNYFLQDVVMRKMEKVFSKVPRAEVTLDPDTAHPRLNLSQDRHSVRLGEHWQDVPDNPKRFNSDCCVLGAQGFSSGRHYWEVEVGGRRGWAVGAARETARRKEKTSGPHPKREIWCVGTNGKKYQALTATEQTSLSPAEKLRRFGVYLDYEQGQLCFYNAESMAHIQTFNDTFRERIFPFFRILAKGTRIRICT